MEKSTSRQVIDLEVSAEELDAELTTYNREIDFFDIQIPRLERNGEFEAATEAKFEQDMLKALRRDLIERINRIHAAKARLL